MSDRDDPELRRKYRNAVDALPRRQREIFLAHLLEDLSFAEIGSRMGLTIRQVEKQMARAMYKLCKQMDGEPLRWWERWF